MSDGMEQFLAQSQEAGTVESEGTFTVDFQKARDKLAKFQLADPHEFVLKIVQAATTSASLGLDVRMGSKVSFTLFGWPDHLTVETLTQRLSSGTLVAGDQPLDHLAVAVNAMLGLGCQEILVRQTLADGQRSSVLKVGQTILLEEGDDSSALPSQLVLTIADRANLSKSRVRTMLEQRCLYSTVPITIDNQPLSVTLPETSGAHRGQYFRSNKLLAQHRYGEFDKTISERGQLFVDKRIPSPRAAHLRLTVDLDPMSTIWLCKAGVLAQMVKLPLAAPGVIGVIAADDLATDLTGFQFLENEKFDEFLQWLHSAVADLKADALQAATQVTADGQPVTPEAPIATTHGLFGCSLAIAGWILSMKIPFSETSRGGWQIVLFLFWLVFPLLYSWGMARRTGAEVDQKSNLNAQLFLKEALTRKPSS